MEKNIPLTNTVKRISQFKKHIEIIKEELVDFENHFLLQKNGFNEILVTVVKSELDCNKGLLDSLDFLNDKMLEVLTNIKRKKNAEKVILDFDKISKSIKSKQSEEDKENNFSKFSLCLSPIEKNSNSNKKEKKFFEKKSRKKRGSYRKFPIQKRRQAINLALRLKDTKKASEILNVPFKNLKRWILVGPNRKKGGRKTKDPEMERKLTKWMIDFKSQYGDLPNCNMVKQEALKLSIFKDSFKASKGWYEKFMNRQFRCKEKEVREKKDKEERLELQIFEED